VGSPSYTGLWVKSARTAKDTKVIPKLLKKEAEAKSAELIENVLRPSHLRPQLRDRCVSMVEHSIVARDRSGGLEGNRRGPNIHIPVVFSSALRCRPPQRATQIRQSSAVTSTEVASFDLWGPTQAQRTWPPTSRQLLVEEDGISPRPWPGTAPPCGRWPLQRRLPLPHVRRLRRDRQSFRLVRESQHVAICLAGTTLPPGS
jgi:hypothetical protein